MKGFGSQAMVDDAEDPLAVTKIPGEWAVGPFHTGWVADSVDAANAEVNLLSNIFPGNSFLPQLGPFPELDIPFCGRTTDNPLAVRLSTNAFGGFGFFEFSVVNDTHNSPENAYTTVIKAAGGGVVPYYNSVATTANCADLAVAFGKAGTPVISTLPDSDTILSLFIRTPSQRWEVVCGWDSLPDPCLGRDYGACGQVAALQAQVAALQAQLARNP